MVALHPARWSGCMNRGPDPRHGEVASCRGQVLVSLLNDCPSQENSTSGSIILKVAYLLENWSNYLKSGAIN
jgi:hypothetical protein